MSVFQSLAEEHRMLWALVIRLERCLQDADERLARRESRNVLLVFLRALEAHERLEQLVYGKSFRELSPEGREALEMVERQHAALTEIRAEASELAARAADMDLRALKPLSARLAQELRAHFASEERELWPRYNALAGRSLRRGLDRRAGEKVKSMARELADYRSAVEEYLG